MNAAIPVHAPQTPPGELARLSAIAKVAAAKGWGHYAERLGFGGGDTAPDSAGKSDAIRLREALEELGPTFIKFGQMVSGPGAPSAAREQPARLRAHHRVARRRLGDRHRRRRRAQHREHAAARHRRLRGRGCARRRLGGPCAQIGKALKETL